MLYECNELISLGSNTVDEDKEVNGIVRTVYPRSGGDEANVEDYGNYMADKYCHEFLSLIKYENLSDLLEDYEDEHSLDNNKDEY